VSDLVLTYSQSTGLLIDPALGHVALGWAGNSAGKNDPTMEQVHCIGPLPKGLYRVGPWEAQHPGLGPLVAHLEQIEGESYGRDGFYIHGPAVDPSHYGQESKGCIVIPRAGREKVWSLDPGFVRVVG